MWGNTFPTRGISGRIDAMTWMPSGPYGMLYFSVREAQLGGACIYRYAIEFYGSDYSYNLRAADPVIVATGECNQDKNFFVSDMTSLSGGVFVVSSPDGVVMRCDGTPLSYWNASTALSSSSVATGLLSVDSGTAAEGGGSNVLIVVAPNVYTQPQGLLLSIGWWMQIELVNMVATAPSPGSSVVWRGDALLVYQHTSTDLEWTTYAGAEVCPLDMHYYVGTSPNGACTSVQCVRAEPCGINSYRAAGASGCSCLPGYFLGGNNNNGACVSCFSAQYPAYCPGGTAGALSCPDHSSPDLSSLYYAGGSGGIEEGGPISVDECLCNTGYYLFAGTCFPCPSNQWCPFNGTTSPVACASGGLTIGSGMSNPLFCFCPSRTYGINCLPCDDSMDCSLPVSEPKMLAAIAVYALGPTWASDLLGECVSPLLIYTVPRKHGNAILSDSGGLLIWSWVLVMTTGRQHQQDINLQVYNLSQCLSQYGFSNVQLQLLGQPRLAVEEKQAISCGGRHWEWNGLDGGASGCTCVGGFELVSTSSLGKQCFPCMNGTVRARRSPSASCTECTGDFEIAPSMGMEACACISGYQKQITGSSSSACVPDPNQIEDSMASSLGIPWWSGQSGTILLVGIAVAVGSGLFCFTLCFAFVSST